VAVIINAPSKTAAVRQGARQAVAAWAAEFGATSWAQVFLKFVLAHPR
jgi:hypothetical protein